MDGKPLLNEYGQVAQTEWLKTPTLRPNVELDEWVIMPDHFHAIVSITERGRGVLQYATTTQPEQTQFRSPSQTIGAIVRGFKSATAKHINQIRQTPGIPVWQRNYHEWVIRNEQDLNRIRHYIRENPIE